MTVRSTGQCFLRLWQVAPQTAGGGAANEQHHVPAARKSHVAYKSERFLDPFKELRSQANRRHWVWHCQGFWGTPDRRSTQREEGVATTERHPESCGGGTPGSGPSVPFGHPPRGRSCTLGVLVLCLLAPSEARQSRGVTGPEEEGACSPWTCCSLSLSSPGAEAPALPLGARVSSSTRAGQLRWPAGSAAAASRVTPPQCQGCAVRRGASPGAQEKENRKHFLC